MNTQWVIVNAQWAIVHWELQYYLFLFTIAHSLLPIHHCPIVIQLQVYQMRKPVFRISILRRGADAYFCYMISDKRSGSSLEVEKSFKNFDLIGLSGFSVVTGNSFTDVAGYLK